jgi:hypothetical protein
MAREESDREDLLREATALVRRIELRTPDEPEPLTAGFRRDGSLSLFFGADPVFQFNTAGELRRAYRSGKLLKAERGRLVELTRVRTAAETQLQREDLDGPTTAALLAEMRGRIGRLFTALSEDRYEIVGQVPAEADVIGSLRDELGKHATRDARIALTPRVGG